MHIHIVGICGTFMGGVAALAKAAGHTVSGCDANVYPPMSTQLDALGIEVIEGFDPAQLTESIDSVVVGNVMSRGNRLVEALLERRIPLTSGPEWLARHVLRGKRVIACAGTHGKTTTASIAAWLLEAAGEDPGFLIGGVPGNFGVSARLGGGSTFVVEADEYDTAFFDKRAKFVHYWPEVAILTNLEFDHADIYGSLDDIKRQFHHLVRTVPRNGRLVVNEAAEALADVLAMGAWSPVVTFGVGDSDADAIVARSADGDGLRIRIGGQNLVCSHWPMQGEHNLENAAAAMLGVTSLGVDARHLPEALAAFKGVRRRLELIGEARGIRLYDDFAHHPTAIRATIEGLRRADGDRRLLIAFEPRSNTMRAGVHKDTLGAAFDGADRVFVYRPPDAGFDIDAAFQGAGVSASFFDDYRALALALIDAARSGDTAVTMSNGGFGSVREHLAEWLAGQEQP